MTPRTRWILSFTIAITSDALDYLALGTIPILGDVLDAITSLALAPLIQWHAAIGLLELVPLVDLAPTWTVAVATAYLRSRHA